MDRKSIGQLFSQMWKGFESLPASRKLTILAAAGITLLSIALAVVFAILLSVFLLSATGEEGMYPITELKKLDLKAKGLIG